MSARQCDVCGISTDQRLLYEIHGCRIFKCGRCGVGSTEIPPGVKPLDMYDERYFDGSMRDGYGDYQTSEAVLRREFKTRVRELLERVPRGGRVLEVGCAYGYFLAQARPHYECVGIEVSSNAVSYCRARGLDVRLGTLHDVLKTGDLGSFDAVVMLDVIEHLEHPFETLSLLHAVSRPDAVLLMTTGDWGSALARAMGRSWRLMTPPQHLFFFSKATLDALLTRAGYEPTAWSHPWKLVPVGLAAYQASRRLGFQLPIKPSFYRIGVPLNLFDVLRVVARRKGTQ